MIIDGVHYRPTKKYAHLTPADYVRIACELLELPQAEIARRAGLKPSHLSEIIHGKRGIGVPVAKRLSKVIHVPVARLLGADESEEKRRKKVERTLKRLKRHVTRSGTIGENTERTLLKDIDDALEANRSTS